jgi:hypothetical protein
MITYAMLARQVILPRPLALKLTPLLPYSCSLFVAPKRVNSFGIKQIQPLFAKHPGCGVPLAAGFRVLCLASPRSITPFRINTSKSATKQTTLTISRINTYAKTGGGYPPPSANVPTFPKCGIPLCALCRRLPRPGRGGQFFRDVQTFRHSDLRTLFRYNGSPRDTRTQLWD